MARADAPEPVQASVLDRLLDDDPSRAEDPPRTLAQSVRDLERTIERDLRDLLNTRTRTRGLSRDLERSLLGYGVRDLTGANLAAESARAEFLASVEQVLRRFEPRFDPASLRVHPGVDEGDVDTRLLRFRIEAVVLADPVPQAVVFDSQLEPAERRFALSVRL